MGHSQGEEQVQLHEQVPHHHEIRAGGQSCRRDIHHDTDLDKRQRPRAPTSNLPFCAASGMPRGRLRGRPREGRQQSQHCADGHPVQHSNGVMTQTDAALNSSTTRGPNTVLSPSLSRGSTQALSVVLSLIRRSWLRHNNNATAQLHCAATAPSSLSLAHVVFARSPPYHQGAHARRPPPDVPTCPHHRAHRRGSPLHVAQSARQTTSRPLLLLQTYLPGHPSQPAWACCLEGTAEQPARATAHRSHLFQPTCAPGAPPSRTGP